MNPSPSLASVRMRFWCRRTIGTRFRRPWHLLSVPGMRESIRRAWRSPRANSRKARLVSWQLVFTKHAQKDAKKLAASGLKPNAQALLDVLCSQSISDPPPPYEKLVGDLAGAYSRRINIQHRLSTRCCRTRRSSSASHVDALRVARRSAARPGSCCLRRRPFFCKRSRPTMP